MSNRLNFTLLALFMIILTGCRNEDEGKLTFEMLSAEKSVKLSNEELSPLCSVSLKMASATKESGEIGEKINAEVVYRLFNQEGIGIQAAYYQHLYRADVAKHAGLSCHHRLQRGPRQQHTSAAAYQLLHHYGRLHQDVRYLC